MRWPRRRKASQPARPHKNYPVRVLPAPKANEFDIRIFGDGSTLQRLPDTPPVVWLDDFTQIMETHDWYAFAACGPAYGNFWADHPCLRRDHDWLALRTDTCDWPRQIRRCQSCGSQVHQDVTVIPPRRGVL